MKSLEYNFDSRKINNSLLEKQKENFVASLGHDLKNPTIAQMRALELLKNGTFGELTQDQQEIVQLLLDSCGYMYSILGLLLSTYKYNNGTIKLKNEKLSLYELTNECVNEMVYCSKSKDIQMIINNKCQNDIITGDRIQLKRVIINLLTNGIKYAYNKTDLYINLYDDADFTCFNFINNSPYLTKKQQKNIFSKYVSFSGHNTPLGTGLGLYSAKKIVQAHGGEIFMQSFADNKNIFGFKIPKSTNIIDKERFLTF